LDRRAIRSGSSGGAGAAGLVPAYPPSAAEALAAAKRATQRLVDLGAQVEEATPDVGNFAQPWQLLFYGGISGYIAAQPAGWEEKLDPGLAGLVRVAQRATAIELAQAHQAQARIYGVVRRFFESYDLLVSPSYAMPAWPVGLDSPIELNGRTIGEDGAAELTILFNLTGQPAATTRWCCAPPPPSRPLRRGRESGRRCRKALLSSVHGENFRWKT
jgi:aspartyl-tRNA(Asn)/glutamyl-tRNA(Gln) amidotransferase subunit A